MTRGGEDVRVFRIETLEVVEDVQIFLTLAIESQEVVLSSRAFDSDPFNREGGCLVACGMKTRCLRCFVKWPMRENKLMSLILFGLEIKALISDVEFSLSFPSLVLIADLGERSHSIFLGLQNYLYYIYLPSYLSIFLNIFYLI